MSPRKQHSVRKTAAILRNREALTPREVLFVAAYTGVAMGKASQAYQIAGYKCKPASLSSNASRLAATDKIQKAIAERIALKVAELDHMAGDEVLKRLTVQARADIGKVLPPDDPLALLPPEARLTIKKVKDTEHGREITLHDSQKALEILGRATGVLRDTTDVTVRVLLEDLLEEVNRPAIEGTVTKSEAVDPFTK